MKDSLVIIGANGHGKVIAGIAKQSCVYKTITFLDDDDTLHECYGLPVAGKIKNALSYIDSSDFFVAIGNADIRKNIMNKLTEQGADFATLCHPAAVIADGTIIGEGSAVMAGAVINPGAVIGTGCIVNTCASVDHDCIIGDFVHVAVGAHVAGTVSVGESTWIGIGAVISNNISVCENCTIGAGAVVVKDIVEPGTYIGVPAVKRI